VPEPIAPSPPEGTLGLVADKSAIEWTDATWNPVIGCSKVSPGCAHCYAEALTKRFAETWKVPGLPWTPANAAANVILKPERLAQPLRWSEPRMVFVNSMSDLFHELVPDEYIARVFAVMAASPQHVFQVLTKRPERMTALLSSGRWPEVVEGVAEAASMSAIEWPLPNVWLGTSIENRRFVQRADLVRVTPAAVRFISAEPLLGPLVPALDLESIDWLIVGGESGRMHRPMSVAWVRELHELAASSGTAFFFKQWGGRTPKANGRMLDGRTWDELPEAHPRSRAEGAFALTG
jgi:protein gp37